jgi:hypothetical protein
VRLPQTFDELDFPVRRAYYGEPVPDLARLEQSRWREVLSQISPGARRLAMATATGDGVDKAMKLVGWLDIYGPSDSWRPPTPLDAPGSEAVASRPKGTPSAAGQRSSRGRERHQLNLRLREHEHRTLVQAAKVAGLRPSQLARMLVVQGATRMLIHEDAVRRRLHEGDPNLAVRGDP